MRSRSIYDVPVIAGAGETTTLAPYRGKILLIVNVASRCGFTAQYKALETLHQQYQSEGLVVLGFPCNQFKQQEPRTHAEIEAFVKQCFRITFPLFEKVDVKGDAQSQLYHYLETHIQNKPWFFIPWNFSKILVDADGHVLRQFLPFTSFKTIEKAIKKLLFK
jgi:glutathione peroxidase